MTIGSNDAATVNGGTITINDYNQAIQEERNRLTRQFGENIGTEYFETENFKRGVLNRLIVEELRKQEVEKLKYDVSPEQIRSYIESEPSLQVEGKFSKEAYANLLAQIRKSPEMLQQDIIKGLKGNALPLMVTNSSFVLNSEIEEQYKYSKQKRDFDYIEISAADFTDKVEVSEQEIKDHYNEFSQDYMTEEQVSVSYIELSPADIISEVDVTDDEIMEYYEAKKDSLTNPEKRKASHILVSVKDGEEQAKDKIEKAAQRLKDGEDFATVAKDVSEDPGSAENGGDLDWVTKGDMVKPFEDKLFSMNSGEISDPVLTEFGYHLIKLDEIKQPEIPSLEETRDTLVDEIKEQKAADLYLTKADELYTYIIDSDNNLELAAENAGLVIQSTELFTRRGGAGSAANPNFIKTAFSDVVLNEQGISDTVDLGENHIAYIKLIEHKLPELKPLEEVSGLIKNKISNEKTLDMARDESQKYLESLKSGEKTMNQLAGEMNKTFEQAKDTERMGSKLPFNLVKNVFAMPFSPDVENYDFVESSGNSFALVKLNSVTNADSSSITDEDKTSISEQIKRSLSNNEIVSVSEELRTDADIYINEKIFITEQ